MKAILIVGEHHQYPAGKLVIARIAASLANNGFKDLYLEGIVPESIPQLKKSTDDKNNNYESYQALYTKCKLANIRMHVSEDPLSQVMIAATGAHPSSFNPQREAVFLGDLLRNQGHAIFLTGANHAWRMYEQLTEKHVDVLVMLLCPNEKDIQHFIGKIPEEVLIYKSSEIYPDKSLEFILNSKLADTSAPIQDSMRQDKEKALPAERKLLEKLHAVMAAFNNFPSKEFQTKMATLEYLIGSLHSREKNLPKAILWTEKSLERKLKNNLGDETVKTSEDKLATLRKQIPKSGIN